MRAPALALLLAAVAMMAMLPVTPAARAAGSAEPGSVVEIGHDAVVDHTVERAVIVGGDLTLGPRAHVTGDAVVLFGDLHRDPGARVDGAQYVVGRSVTDWIPGPGWVAGVVLVVALLVYRIAVWAAVCAIAATLPRTALYERWSTGWERRPGLALLAGIVAVAIAVPLLGLLAITGVGLALALLGLAGLLLACGAGLSLFREGPLWPRRPSRIAYVGYLVLPPALEVGLLLTAAAGLGAAIARVSRGRAAA